MSDYSGRESADPFGDRRIDYVRDRLCDPIHMHLMITIIAEVEPVAEHGFEFQPRIVELRRSSTAGLGIVHTQVRDSLLGPRGIERAWAELRLVEVSIGPIEGSEDRPLRLAERLIAVNLDADSQSVRASVAPASFRLPLVRVLHT